MGMNKKFKKICSLFLIFSIVFITSISPVAAHTASSLTYLDPDKNNGVYLVENLTIEGKDYTFTHSRKDGKNIIDISGAEEHTIVASDNSDKIYVDNEVAGTINRMASSDGWTYFGPETHVISWKEGASVALIAGLMAVVVSGPVVVFYAAASILAGVSIGCSIIYSGRYKVEGIYVEGEYTASVYHGSEWIDTVNWSGRR